mmetsp:Transcript_42574/g.83706  ORF Transcript_42574/g.83706 Transcript_42574/m.83706 type:complete len:166 (-) Transcript_42574:212-709(-)
MKFSTALLGLASTFLFSHVSAYSVTCKSLVEGACKLESSKCYWKEKTGGQGKCTNGKCKKLKEKKCGTDKHGCEWIIGGLKLKCGKEQCDKKLGNDACMSPCIWKDGQGCRKDSDIKCHTIRVDGDDVNGDGTKECYAYNKACIVKVKQDNKHSCVHKYEEESSE